MSKIRELYTPLVGWGIGSGDRPARFTGVTIGASSPAKSHDYRSPTSITMVFGNCVGSSFFSQSSPAALRSLAIRSPSSRLLGSEANCTLIPRSETGENSCGSFWPAVMTWLVFVQPAWENALSNCRDNSICSDRSSSSVLSVRSQKVLASYERNLPISSSDCLDVKLRGAFNLAISSRPASSCCETSTAILVSALCSIVTPTIMTMIKNPDSIFSNLSLCFGITRTSMSPASPTARTQYPMLLQNISDAIDADNSSKLTPIGNYLRLKACSWAHCWWLPFSVCHRRCRRHAEQKRADDEPC
jgi:hypothetical protein